MLECPERGQIVGEKYRVVRQLGRGGMAIVFEAENVATGKRVALKWMQREVSADDGAGERLLREAQLAARVRHPNVIDIYDADRHGGDLFLVMEYLEGESLRALLERGGTPPAELLKLLIGAMRGVSAAHKESVIHRDIKPENIFLARTHEGAEPIPKVLDFGISATLDARPLRLTTAGLTFGTPIYMSYEQLSGARDIDARTDVYSFGVILYEALTGHVPFEATSVPELIVKIATAPPVRLRKHRPDLPYALERVVLAAISKDRARRTVSLDALIAELEPCVTDLVVGSLPPAPLPARPLRATARLAGGSVLVRIVQRELHQRGAQVLAAVGLVAVVAVLILQWAGAHPAATLSARATSPAPRNGTRDGGTSVRATVLEERPVQRVDEPPTDAGAPAESATTPKPTLARPAWTTRRVRARPAPPAALEAPSEALSERPRLDGGTGVRHRVQTPRAEEF